MNIYKETIRKILTESDNSLLSIVTVGSIPRGNDDKLSDYDFLLIWDKKIKADSPEGACRMNNKKCGIRNFTYQDLEKRKWSQVEKFSFTHSIIEYDPKNLLPGLIKNKCVWEKGERVELFCKLLFELSYVSNVTDNYKGCWNERDELHYALERGQKIDSIYLALSFALKLIQIAIITDKSFLPPDKVCFSRWIKNISPTAFEIYEKTQNNINILTNPHPGNLKKFYQRYTKTILDSFERQERLPSDISVFRYNLVRKGGH